jgi:hypothetical protein
MRTQFFVIVALGEFLDNQIKIKIKKLKNFG